MLKKILEIMGEDELLEGLTMVVNGVPGMYVKGMLRRDSGGLIDIDVNLITSCSWTGDADEEVKADAVPDISLFD